MLELFFRPFSSYSQKVLVALFENATQFAPRLLVPEIRRRATRARALAARSFPVLKVGERTIVEASAIVEYLDIHHRGTTRMIPDDPDGALDVRMRDRIFDNYIMTPMQTIVYDRRRSETHRDPHGVERAREILEKAYARLESELATRHWATGYAFSLADCAAAPSLFYANRVHPLGDRFPQLAAYRARLAARPSVKRTFDAARPYRGLFPGGAPDHA